MNKSNYSKSTLYRISNWIGMENNNFQQSVNWQHIKINQTAGWLSLMLELTSMQWLDTQQAYLESLKQRNTYKRWLTSVLQKIFQSHGIYGIIAMKSDMQMVTYMHN